MFWLSSDIKQVSIKNVAIGIFLLILAGYGYFGEGSALLPELNDKQNMLIIGVIGLASLFYGVKDYFFYHPDEEDQPEADVQKKDSDKTD